MLIADAAKVKGLAPPACKTDKIDTRALAVLSARDLVPEIWLPDPRIRRERELARFRTQLVKHRSMLKHRIPATLITFGHPCPVSDLFGVAGRELLERLEIPQPWRGTVDAGDFGRRPWDRRGLHTTPCRRWSTRPWAWSAGSREVACTIVSRRGSRPTR